MVCDKCSKEFEPNGETEGCPYCADKREIQKPQEIQKSEEKKTVNKENITENKEPEKKKKSHKGLIILIILLLIIAAVACIYMSACGVFGAKDLGVKYTKADFNSAMQKTGVNLAFDGKSGDELYNYLQDYKKSGEKLSWSDYTLKATKYEERSFVLTDKEATAFVSEIAPQFFAFKDLQIKVLDNGEIAGSGTVSVDQIVSDFSPESKDKVPNYVPDKLNFYAKGNLSVNENVLSLDVKELKTGAIQTVSPQQANENAKYFEELYECVPGLQIHSLKTTSDGKISVDATVPIDAQIVKK